MTGPEFCDRPNPNPVRRPSMERLLVDLAERNGDPVFPVTHMRKPTLASKHSRQAG